MKKPLEIYVLWHEKYSDGVKYANQIYSNFSRNIENPISRGIGIPVYFRNIIATNDSIKEIPYNVSDRVAIIIFIDSYIVTDDVWKNYIQSISNAQQSNNSIIIYPVAVNVNAFNFEIFPKKNYIRMYEFSNDQQLHNWITHELCRLLYNKARIADVNATLVQSPQPITLFISHAKDGGKSIAKQIDNYINGETPLKAFFDATDIAAGYDFDQEIETNINNSVLLVIHTDKYSSREWCRREVLLAKRYNRPIIVINMFETGEDRIFPYMANFRSIRIEQPLDTEKLETIIFYALIDTLRFKYYELNMNYSLNTLGLNSRNYTVLSTPPELLTLLYLSGSENSYAVYPDPPLGGEETDILNIFKPNIKFITPTFIPLTDIVDQVNIDSVFNKLIVGLSISESENILDYGFEIIHLKDIIVEIARYLLATGTTIAYGGDIKYKSLNGWTEENNFTQILFDLVLNYNKENIRPCEKVNNYMAYPFYSRITPDDKARLANIAKVIEIEPFKNSKHLDPIELLNIDTVEKQYLIAENLSNMRDIMCDSLSATIILGGKINGYLGKYPGLFEEAYISLSKNRPTYIIGV